MFTRLGSCVTQLACSGVLWNSGRGGLEAFPERIDVRSPAEFAQDHIPDAINCPVLDDGERVRIGTMHAQVSALSNGRVTDS